MTCAVTTEYALEYFTYSMVERDVSTRRLCSLSCDMAIRDDLLLPLPCPLTQLQTLFLLRFTAQRKNASQDQTSFTPQACLETRGSTVVKAG